MPRKQSLKRRTPEQDFHKRVAQLLDTVLIAPAFYTTFPAGGGGKIRGAILKSMGLKPGMPDLLVFWSDARPDGTRPHILGLELKSKTGSLSKEQKAISFAMHANGMHYEVCRGEEDVIRALSLHGCSFVTLHFQGAAERRVTA